MPDLAHLSERRLTILRRERIGFVFQAFNLLPSLTVAQNIAQPLLCLAPAVDELGGLSQTDAPRLGHNHRAE